MKRSGAQGWTTLPLEKIYYYRGNLLFWYRDFDAAVDQLRKATARAADLDPHTALMAWLRLGQASDMKGQLATRFCGACLSCLRPARQPSNRGHAADLSGNRSSRISRWAISNADGRSTSQPHDALQHLLPSAGVWNSARLRQSLQ